MALRNFWHMLLHQDVPFARMSAALAAIQKASSRADRTYKVLLERCVGGAVGGRATSLSQVCQVLQIAAHASLPGCSWGVQLALAIGGVCRCGGLDQQAEAKSEECGMHSNARAVQSLCLYLFHCPGALALGWRIWVTGVPANTHAAPVHSTRHACVVGRPCCAGTPTAPRCTAGMHASWSMSSVTPGLRTRCGCCCRCHCRSCAFPHVCAGVPFIRTA